MQKSGARSLPSLSLRIDLDREGRIGPGKIQLLENIRKLGSISAAGRAMGMSYRHAWLLVDSLNQAFRQPVIATRAGGHAQRRAELTPFGRELISRYHAMQTIVATALADHLHALEDALKDGAEPPSMRDPGVPQG